jgi:hypothetical protein
MHEEKMVVIVEMGVTETINFIAIDKRAAYHRSFIKFKG